MKLTLLSVVAVVAFTLGAFPASETVTNNSGSAATGVTVQFSAKVTVTSWDTAVFPKAEPTGRAQSFVFSGGSLAKGGRFKLSWNPSSASIASIKWTSKSSAAPSASTEAPAIEREVATLSATLTAASGATLVASVRREIERHVLPFQVLYEVTLPPELGGTSVFWDTDTRVDSDGNGDAASDADVQGPRLDLTFVENYNPTVSLHAVDAASGTTYTWEDMVRNDFLVGQAVLLEGVRLLAASGVEPQSAAQAKWIQLHMEQNSLDYMTEYTAALQNPESLSTQFVPQNVGKYVISLGPLPAALGTHEAAVAAWVVEDAVAGKSVGILMGDVWNDYFDDQGRRIEGAGTWFTDEEAKEKLRYLSSEGLDTIGVHAGIVLDRTLPTPHLTSEAPNLLSDADLRDVLNGIPDPHLAIQTFVSLLADPQWGDEGAWVRFDALSRTYFEAYFPQYKARVLELAALASTCGVSSLTIAQNHPYLWGLGGISNRSMATGRWVAQQWAEMVKAVKQVFSGEVGLSVPGPGTAGSEPLRGIADFIDFTMGGYCYWGDCSQQKRISATRTAEELQAALESFYWAAVEPTSKEFGTPILFPVAAASFKGAARVYAAAGHEQSAYKSWRPEFALGGYGDEILNGSAMAPFEPSFRDQSLLLEALLPVLAAMQSVDAVYFWGEYWKLLSFEDFAPQNELELHAANNVSLQGKPAFQVAKLWASILAPNDRNLYRHVQAPKANNSAPGCPGPRLGGSAGDTPYVTLEVREVLAEDCSENELIVSYTPKVADDFGGLFKGVSLVGFPEEGREESTALSFRYKTDNPALLMYLTLWDGDGEAFTYDVPDNQSILGDGEWHELVAPLDLFIFGGFDSPETGNKVLDLATLKKLAINLVDMNGVGRTTTLHLKNIQLIRAAATEVTSEAPDWEAVAYARSYPRPVSPIKLYLESVQVPVSSGQHWGLPGSDVKGIKLFADQAGFWIRWETYDPDISGKYRYANHLRPPTRDGTLMTVVVSPATGEAHLTLDCGQGSLDLDSSIRLVVLTDDSLTILIHGSALPCGGSVQDLMGWDLVAALLYGSSWEWYELPATLGQGRQGMGQWAQSPATGRSFPGVSASWSQIEVPGLISAVAEWDGKLLMLEWETARLRAWPESGGRVELFATIPYSGLFFRTSGMLVRDDTLYTTLTSFRDGIAGFSLTTAQESEPFEISPPRTITATELAGLLESEGRIYILGYAGSSGRQALAVYDIAQDRISYEKLVGKDSGELIGLIRYDGALYSLAVEKKAIVRLDLTGTMAVPQIVCSVSDLVPAMTGGAPWAFYLSDTLVCLGEVTPSGTTILHLIRPSASLLAPLD
jgi:hypothetical protein